MAAHAIERLTAPVGDSDVRALALLLVDAVESGAAISFLAPLSLARAEEWWRKNLAAREGSPIVVVARDDRGIAGCVQMHPAWAPNQPHRAEITKLLVHRRSRRQGLGEQLMRAIEREARAAGLTLLTLDAKRGEAAERLYRRLGWIPAGTIPRYALDTDGTTPHDAVVFYKSLERSGDRTEGRVIARLSHALVRSWREEDAPSLAAHADNRNVWRHLRDRFPSPYTLTDARAFIRTALAGTPETVFAIAVEDAAVGGIGFALHEDVERVSAEIGYWLGEAFWGRGIMTEALAAVTAFAVRAHDLTRVFAVPFEGNAASFRVLEKAGYVLEGCMKRSAIKDGRVVGQRLYAYTVPDDPLPGGTRTPS
jgi:RimJ/RimL family protein N-acetyltransferase